MSISELEFPSINSAPPPNPPPSFDISTFSHTPFYCEENVYSLCKKLSSTGVARDDAFDLFVMFISNEDKQVPLWHQKASKRTDGLVVWDYHVICLQRYEVDSALNQVWDLDSSLPLPAPLHQYVSEALQPSLPFFFKHPRLFRVVHAPIFLRWFASDRRHMKDPNGNWISQPPACEPIVAEDGTVNNLDEYIGMRESHVITDAGDLIHGLFSQKFGVVISETQLEDLFALIPS
ncbi:amino-terminal glutamine amidohydrolase isoform X2 [Tasmannia lanceolata]|uniref:amino-terminal glutamine amidohydrolase isoform X2 n=1 Tax=Tasmannia lanceolata TaxID=3420 RepID=UPI0040640425